MAFFRYSAAINAVPDSDESLAGRSCLCFICFICAKIVNKRHFAMPILESWAITFGHTSLD